ncbi:MAG: hypothetical protein QM485_14120 [Flavobacteriaceae bacterium]
MHSRKIISDSLEITGYVRALKKALYHNKTVDKRIHHSGRAIQYYSNVYINALKRKKIDISMTEENHCYENAMMSVLTVF